MSAHTGLTERLLQALRDCGPMTGAELVEYLGETKHRVSSSATRLQQSSSKVPKRIHVTQYVFDHEGQRRYPRPVFALGDHPDAQRPKSNPKETKRRYEARRKTMLTRNFVFNLGNYTHRTTLSNLAKKAAA